MGERTAMIKGNGVQRGIVDRSWKTMEVIAEVRHKGHELAKWGNTEYADGRRSNSARRL